MYETRLSDRQRHDLDNYITGHYGEDQCQGQEDLTVHEEFCLDRLANGVYLYDSADDGPEREVITRILTHHAFYRPGAEGDYLRYMALVNGLSRKTYGRRFYQLGKKRQAMIRSAVAAGALRWVS